jgi:phosphohistidine phosphatase
MELVMIRHAIAEEREMFAQTSLPDEQRPLTNLGRQKMKDIAAGLKSVVGHLDLLASSPLVRAVQTAEIIGEVFEGMPIVLLNELAPTAAPERLTQWLGTQPLDSRIAVVGHEPGLGRLASRFLDAEGRLEISIKKGGMCLVEFADSIGPGFGVLRWFVKPSMFRKLGMQSW